jgi:hypothetical protein
MGTKAALIGGLVAGVLLASTTANAQWITNKSGGDFDDNPTYVAVTSSNGYALALRCQKGEPEIGYLTPDGSVSKDMYKTLNEAGPKLRIKIDSGDIVSLAAVMEDADGKLKGFADASLDLYEKIRDAKSSISVVLTLRGENFHENRFGTKGARNAASKLISGCKLSEAKKP